MTLKDIIQANHWLSVELTFRGLYPEEIDELDDYRNVYEKLKILKPEAYHLQIVLTTYEDDLIFENEEAETYVDVSGLEHKTDANQTFESYAIEFLEWNKWLGMEIATNTVREFSQLEIIAHCLREMTFVSFDEQDIKTQLDSLNKTADDYKNMSDEEKEKNTFSLDELKKRLNKNK